MDQLHDADRMHVRLHLVGSPEDFPAEIQSLTQSLEYLAQDVMEVDLIAEQDPRLGRALKAAHSCSARARRVIMERDLYGDIEPEPTTQAVGLAPGYILEQCEPELQPHFQCEYSRAIYPCWQGNSSSRLLRPYGSLVSAVTMPLYLAESNIDASGDDDTDCSYLIEAFDPLLQAHLLRNNHGHDEIPFPVLFVAVADEIYELLASAVLHIHALGMCTPCLAFLHNPLDFQLRAVWAWSAPRQDHPCLEVHVAHAPWSTMTSPELGIFDMEDKESATALAIYLHSISSDLYINALTAQENALGISNNLKKTSAVYWRVDQNNFFHEKCNHIENIKQWLCDLDAFSDTLFSPPSMWPPQEGLDGEKMIITGLRTVNNDKTKLVEAKSALAGAKRALKLWMSLHPSIVFADLSQISALEIDLSSAVRLDPDLALCRGNRVTRCHFPAPEFREQDTTPEPLKMSLEYLRCSLPPCVNIASTGTSQLALPVIPPEIDTDNESDIGISCTLSALEDVEAIMNFRAAGQVENWLRINLNLAPLSPLDATMTVYLMDNISTFSKVCDLSKHIAKSVRNVNHLSPLISE
ncbi:hypothetical protein CYLTODRAFT_427355 [Cylindrobasidium torrendii FP15055 ss-10]|uniref:Uncharacterized protein n=1 Tax=Cylindrobasidium torrendii FP15055 ss-10 TaxID=1314674 RepID=A0A0D7AU81_9AGAR|nr:hypothetical protein CYLTODRAFT_427355 [Cylindrobasidium torrendii FP15055 ss-10]